MLLSQSNETLPNISMSGGSSASQSKNPNSVLNDESKTKTNAADDLVVSRPPAFEVIFQRHDAENPKDWPKWYRIWTIVTVSFSAWVVVLYSTSYTGSVPGLRKEFGTSATITTLGMTTYLLGLAIGSVFVAPLSELFGRRVVYLSCLCIWSVFIVPCAMAKSITTILVFRFVGYVSYISPLIWPR